MTRLHQNNFATNVTTNQVAGVTTTPLNSIPSIAAPFYLAFDATNINGHYEVLDCTSKTATNVNHAASAYAHTTDEEVRMIIPAAEMDALNEVATGAEITTGTNDAKKVTCKALADATVGKLGSAWANWTVSWTNFTIGAGTVTSVYTQIGKTVFYKIKVACASDTNFGTDSKFSLPVTASSNGMSANVTPMGQVTFHDSGTGYIQGIVTYSTTTVAQMKHFSVTGTLIKVDTTTSTAPFDITTGDEISIEGFYEAA